MQMKSFGHASLSIALTLVGVSAQAADWSDTSVSFRTGTQFAEPFNASDISKNIVNFSHISGYKYGSNFFSADLLMSDNKDPAGFNSPDGAHEVYFVYRHTLDLEKATGKAFKFGPVRGMGLTAGFDYNTKTDAGYNSKKRMLVAGPVFNLDVPGFLNVGLLGLWESNAPYSTFPGGGATARHTYDTHAMVNAVWGIPLGSLPLSFEGYANFIAAKGKNEFGGDTAAETLIDMQVMYDIGAAVAGHKNKVRIGLQYQYWKNKFGNDSDGPAGKGAFAKTPMVRVEYHF